MSDTEIQTNEEPGLIAYVFTNNIQQGGFLQSLLDMFYRGCFSNTIGIMSARNKETDEEELVLVGVEHLEDGNTLTYPLARVLKPEEGPNYIGPDGKGGWLEPEVEATFPDDGI